MWSLFIWIITYRIVLGNQQEKECKRKGREMGFPCCLHYMYNEATKECLKCPNGYSGWNCTEKCTNGLFGKECQTRCPSLCENSCDHINGQCVSSISTILTSKKSHDRKEKESTTLGTTFEGGLEEMNGTLTSRQFPSTTATQMTSHVFSTMKIAGSGKFPSNSVMIILIVSIGSVVVVFLMIVLLFHVIQFRSNYYSSSSREDPDPVPHASVIYDLINEELMIQPSSSHVSVSETVISD